MLTELGEKVSNGEPTLTPQKAILAVLEAAEAFIDAVGEQEMSAAMDALGDAVHDYRQCIGKKYKQHGQQKPAAPIPVKTCSRCRRDFPIDLFPVSKSDGKEYRRAWCADCLKNYYREHAANKRAKLVVQ